MLEKLFNSTIERAFTLHRKLYERSSAVRMATHIYRIVYQLGVKVIVCAPLLIVGTPVLAAGLLFVDKNACSLPKWLKWFDNADEDGLIGDIPNQERNKARGIDPTGYLAKLLWLGFRNNLNYFKYRVLGLKTSDIVRYTAIVEKTDVPGEFVGDYRSGGIRFIEVELKNGARRYEYYIIWPYHLFNQSLCFRARFGWKLGHPDEPNKQRPYYEWACTINPFCPYRGKWPEQLPKALEKPLLTESPAIPERAEELMKQLVLQPGLRSERLDSIEARKASPSQTPYYQSQVAEARIESSGSSLEREVDQHSLLLRRRKSAIM